MNFNKKFTLIILSFLLIASCTSTSTGITKDTTVGSRIGQLAITQAMDSAFGQLNFFMFKDKKVVTEVVYLGQSSNNEFYNAYVGNKIFLAGGRPVDSRDNADILLKLLIKVGGIDENNTNFIIFSRDYVTAQFDAIATISHIESGELLKSQSIFGEATVRRSGV